MAVVAGSLIRTQSHHTTRLLEGHAGADNSINDSNRAGIDDHGGPAFGNKGSLLICAVSKMNGNEGFIQIAQFIQEGGGPLAITLNDLIGLSVPLLHMHVDFGSPVFDRLLDAQQHLWADKVSALGPKQDLDPTARLVVPLVIQGNVSIQALFAHGVIKLIELAGLIDPPFGRPDGLGNVASCPHLVDERTHVFHLGFIVAQRSGARPDGLQNGHPAARISLLIVDRVVKRLKTEHHPTIGVLGQAPHDVASRVHVAVNKAGQHHVMIQDDGFLSGIFH